MYKKGVVMKKKGYTITEVAASLVVLGIIISTFLYALKPSNIKIEMMDKMAKNTLIQLEYATKQILAKNTYNYSLLNIIGVDNNQFSITSNDAEQEIMKLYKKYLMGLRDFSASSSYFELMLKDKDGVESSYLVSSFDAGFKMKNGVYFAIKLNGNCSTNETKIYNPILPDKRTMENSCGLAFFDLNTEEAPNTLGVDQFIVSIGKFGIK